MKIIIHRLFESRTGDRLLALVERLTGRAVLVENNRLIWRPVQSLRDSRVEINEGG